MRIFLTLLLREIYSYLLSPIAYVLGCLFLFVMGLLFSYMVNAIASQPQTDSVTYFFFSTFWIPGLIIPSIITMRLFSEEKKSGTVEMLMTAPVTEWQVTMAKFLGALCIYSTMWIVTILYVIILRYNVTNPEVLEVRTFFTAYLFILLNSALLIAAGTWASSLTRNQIIAAIISFVFSFVILLIPELLVGALKGNHFGEVIQSFSAFTHIGQFANGIIEVQPVVFYLTGTFFFLFGTVTILESRKWK
ncbi:MAG: ABC transporter permease [Verrucomicrobiota bacterium]|nr:ABC transporter permease [Verrucomicrobiota bacterium]